MQPLQKRTPSLAHLALLVAAFCLAPCVGIRIQNTLTKTNRELEAETLAHVQSWFDVVEAKIQFVNYSHVPECSAESIPYINAVVHISKNKWDVHCGDLSRGSRGPPLKEILDSVVPLVSPSVDTYLPIGLHDGVQNVHAGNQFLPVVAAVYHPLYSDISIPFAMGCVRSDIGYVNTPVIGWDDYVKKWFTCSNSVYKIKKAVFRGKATVRNNKFGTCFKGCTDSDNGRLFMHQLGLEKPDLFDAFVSNYVMFNLTSRGDAGYVTLPDQACNYAGVLNIGNNMDWAERLRQLFYGNAVVMLPDNAPFEFFNSFLKPYEHYWPIAADLSDIVEQTETLLYLTNQTEMVEGQRRFAATYLTESFMLMFDKLVIEEYARRSTKGPTTRIAAAGNAGKQKLGVRGCDSSVRRECTAVS